jgi:hypothetical protein
MDGYEYECSDTPPAPEEKPKRKRGEKPKRGMPYPAWWWIGAGLLAGVALLTLATNRNADDPVTISAESASISVEVNTQRTTTSSSTIIVVGGSTPFISAVGPGACSFMWQYGKDEAAGVALAAALAALPYEISQVEVTTFGEQAVCGEGENRRVQNLVKERSLALHLSLSESEAADEATVGAALQAVISVVHAQSISALTTVSVTLNEAASWKASYSELRDALDVSPAQFLELGDMS